jgi:hypothetical protein
MHVGETDCWYPQLNYYSCLQDGMVNAWREFWGDDFAFIFTQLSTWNGYGYGTIPSFRTIQESILKVTEKVAMITAADLGDPYSTMGDIHPRNKTEVGRRMSLAASSLMYGLNVPYAGPIVDSLKVVSDEVTGYKVHMSFTKESCGSGIYLQAAQLCPETSVAVSGGCGYVELSHSTYKVIANVYLAQDECSVDIIPTAYLNEFPEQLSYCIGDYPLMTVYNDVGAPLLPFVYDL